MSEIFSHNIEIPSGKVSALSQRPDEAVAHFLFAHGAGAGMQHEFMENMAARLVARDIAVTRFQFPYMEAGSRRPDRAPVCTETVYAAIDAAKCWAPDLPLFVGGKSFGGRMTSTALSERDLDAVHGIIFFGFPLHPPKKEGVSRAEHLASVQKPMVFLQGTRDALANLELILNVCSNLGELATLSVVQGADHSFQVLKRSGLVQSEVEDEVANRVVSWIDGHLQ